MDATCRKVLGLISEMNVRFVVPVYQRPYSWDEEQCVQLWDDILETGRKRKAPHFTGSIVTIQDGSLSPAGVAPLLLIDGQQRITTITLVLIALARYAEAHPQEALSFSRDEIVMSGYLTNHFRQGDDHYKLTMSKGDRDVYRQLVDSLEDPAVPAPEDEHARLLDNLGLFERRLEALDDVDSVWAGLQRLEVVAITLSQGQDNPQLIFESMNSTGKDLSCADLVRNFVLMGFPMTQQQEVYQAYWGPIEQILGSDSSSTYDAAFEDFIRCYLTSVWAPTSFARGDAYQAFKRYIVARSYDRDGRIRDFSLRLKRFARYYAAITGGPCDDRQLGAQLVRIHVLGVPAVRPLLLSLLNAFDQHAFSREDLLGMLGTIESYLLRRSACECEGSVLPRFFSSLIARLDAVRGSDGDYVTAFYAMLANEADTPCRFPGDDEFKRALGTRDAFFWRDTRALLARVEAEADGAKTPDDLYEAYSVVHVMPPRALGVNEWRTALGPDPEGVFEQTVGSLGNLTLARSDYDPQDDTWEQKRELLSGGGDGPALGVSADILASPEWGTMQVGARAFRLVSQAVRLWPYPDADDEACRLYRRRRDTVQDVTFADLFEAGLVRAGDRLVSGDPMYPGSATVTYDGQIMLEDGQSCPTPQDAAKRFLAMLGASPDVTRNGWLLWRRGEGGPMLDELREVLL